MSEYGIIICEHPTDAVLPETVGGFSVYRRYKYGKIVNVTIYKKPLEEVDADE